MSHSLGVVILIPDHWYLVNYVYEDGREITTVVRFSGVDEEHNNRLVFESYEEPGLVKEMSVIRELPEDWR